MIRAISIMFLLSSVPVVGARDAPLTLQWSKLAALPDAIGFASPFAGVSQGSLIVAGGANFPNGRPWDGATKVWHDRIFVLDAPKGEWREAGRLPRCVAYGVSVTIPEGLLCIGGSDSREHFSEAFLLRVSGQIVERIAFPSLPRSLANAAGALVGRSVYVSGGLERPDATPAIATWVMDLTAPMPDREWRRIEDLPGRPRMLAVAGATSEAFYLFSGTDLVSAANGKLTREYLRDAWRYAPTAGWSRLRDLPEPRVAAPSPAPVHAGRMLVIGGDDGELAARVIELKDAHPGFSRTTLAYDPTLDAWTVSSEPATAFSTERQPIRFPVTTSALLWQGRIVIPSGEVRPGVRSPDVIEAGLGPVGEPRD